MSVSIEKVAIANRGEVAVRIIHACREMGLKSALLHSEADMDGLAYRMADEQVCIGPASVQESYLNIESNIQGALSAGVDAIHPGFGFLSENADFAQACQENGLIFVGPSPETIRVFGDKIAAKELVERAGGPVIPGYQGEDHSKLASEAERIGYPVMVKATAGGGGRGLKVAHAPEELSAAVAAAQREGKSAFGSDRIFLEKYLDHAKHIEVQIFGDALGEIYHLFERECSVQRRHQKVVEEAPSAQLDDELREEIIAAAVRIAREGKYRGAGTLEFLVQDDGFYFLEMNTRLQVEHPVTECYLGIDLVKAQLLTAQGLGVLWEQSQLGGRGHSIECRIYAENSYLNGIPSTGELGFCHWPRGPGRRFEVGFESGDEITPFYDSMIAKVIVWDESRPRAIQKMRKTLEETIIFGVHTNIPYLQAILSHNEFVSGEMTTRFIENHFAQGIADPGLSPLEKKLVDRLEVQDHSSTAEANPWLANWGQG